MKGMFPTKLPILSPSLSYSSLCHLAREGRKHSLHSLHLPHLRCCSRDFCLMAGQRPSRLLNGLRARISTCFHFIERRSHGPVSMIGATSCGKPPPFRGPISEICLSKGRHGCLSGDAASSILSSPGRPAAGISKMETDFKEILEKSRAQSWATSTSRALSSASAVSRRPTVSPGISISSRESAEGSRQRSQRHSPSGLWLRQRP